MLDNTALIASSNHYFALATLVGFIIVLIWIVDLAFLKLGFLKSKQRAYEVLAAYAIPLGFFVSLFAMVGSLYYSYYLHIPACELCWFARIFIYQLVFIFGLAWYKRDTKVYDYVLLISGVGFLIALYHHYLQMGYELLAPCSTAPFAVDCSTPTFIEYGFVTFPFMGVVTLAVTFLLALTAKMFQK